MPRYQDAIPASLASPSNSPIFARPRNPSHRLMSIPATSASRSEALLASAEAHRRAARDEYKIMVRAQAAAAAGAHVRGKVSKQMKLQKNRESAAAARHANKEYRLRLERVVQESEVTQAKLAAAAVKGRMHRDALAEKVLALRDHVAALWGDLPDDLQEEDNECCTKTLLESTSHIPELRMTPSEFALSLMGPVACPAL